MGPFTIDELMLLVAACGCTAHISRQNGHAQQADSYSDLREKIELLLRQHETTTDS